MRHLRSGAWVVAVTLVAVLLVPALAPGGALRPTAAGATVAGCDPIDDTQCLLPFPDNFFTHADARTGTHRRLALTSAVMPQNKDGKPIDPTDWNRSDGFSPGSELVVRVPGVDLAQTGVATIRAIGDSLAADAPIVLLDAVSHHRLAYWAELDTWNSDAATQAIVIRPAKNFTEGHRILVGLRNMKDAAGDPIAAPAGFAVLRDEQSTADAQLEARRAAIDDVIDGLALAGVQRSSLYLAWDFTVASARGLAGPMLDMRDDAYAQLGFGVPVFHVTHVDQNVSSDVLRRVQGTFDVPQYLSGTGAPGSRLVRGSNGLPKRTGTFHAEFRCLIPRSSVKDGHAVPTRGIVYGHGLLGGTSEIEGFGQFANQARVVICATPWIGMASQDLPNVAGVINDFSRFGSIPDRLRQGFLNFQFLARLVKDWRGFGANANFEVGEPSKSVLVTNSVFYNGNSQGGILGGAATAISKEWTRAVLGVPAINFSTLLPRSVDFDPFLSLVSTAYPDESQHTLEVALIQILWDRGESDGYAQHMTSHPYHDTPNHSVLLIEAFGDHQVANIGTETEARTIGAVLRPPTLAAGRSDIVQQFWGIPSLPAGGQYKGSVLEVWDFGTPKPPLTSVPPESPAYGDDPHGLARNVAVVRRQVSEFLRANGVFVDVCGIHACHAS